jgi:hypothetical protein
LEKVARAVFMQARIEILPVKSKKKMDAINFIADQAKI